MEKIVVQRLIKAPVQFLGVLAFSASLLVSAAQAQSADADDTARLLAGMQPSAASAVLALTKDLAWQHHSTRLNAIFAQVENRQLARIRTWSRMKLTAPSPVLFYMFSGPDFLYASAFFPNASTYVMSGLEPTGPIPDLKKLSRESLAHGLRNIEESLGSILSYSFFQTIDMRRTLVASSLPGTLPILYVFLARSGKTIKDVSLVRIDQDGTAQVDDGVVGADAKSPRGVKIEFVGENGQRQTLYYFSANVDNDGFRPSGFMRFCERLGSGDAFVKSASYLMHREQFSEVRDFLLGHSRLLLQDDSGIPVTHFDQGRWQLHPFGHYSGPISLFASRYQSKLAQLFDRNRAEPIEFGVGYRWRSQTSNLMLAVKTEAANDGAVAGAQPNQVSAEVPVDGEHTSEVNRTESGNEAGAHKTVNRGRVHRGTKHTTRAKWIAQTRVRTRALQANDGASFWFRSWN